MHAFRHSVVLGSVPIRPRQGMKKEEVNNMVMMFTIISVQRYYTQTAQLLVLRVDGKL